LLEIVVENVDAIAVGMGRAGGSLRGRAAVRAAEATAATAATAATMAVVTAAVMVAWTAVWAASVAPKVAAARAVVGGWQRWRQQLW
jgi:hypothetical protein